MTLAEARRRFVRHRSPQFILVAFVLGWTARLLVGGWVWRDLIVAAVIIGLQPFTEWLIHVHVLHSKGSGIAARKHRAHHLDPPAEELIFVPHELLLPGLPLATVIVLVIGAIDPHGFGPPLSGLAVGFTLLLLYEWTHFLIHSNYRPKTEWYRRKWRAHRLHHFRNEQYWFGVTLHQADHLLKTYKQKDEVPLSPTARTLGIDEPVAS